MSKERPSSSTGPRDDARRREADKVLGRLADDNGSFGLPFVDPGAGRSDEDAETDPAVRWGRRVGRGLWLVAILVVLFAILRIYMRS